MSGNVGKGVRTDRRVLRTRDTLGDALVELMHEKPFDDITVQEVLDRAGVGRSTFYAHYKDKDDLLLSDVEDFFKMFSTMLTRRGANPQRLAPVTEFFTHIAEAQDFVKAMQGADKMSDVLELGHGLFARGIEERLVLAGVDLEPAELAARSYALAGSFFALLDWWVGKGMKTEPKEMDALFHRMAWSGVSNPQ
jgi:AcrR family transcriptional regulator